MANKKNTIQMSKEKKEYMISEIKAYFKKERDEDLGDLASALILVFIVEKLAPEFFNQGIAEAHKYLTDKLEDIFALQK
jgi:uncharacterized protein (DUF2164 family)